ncbi:HesA/MoeB/ThiF family protein [Roseovarius sp. EL26]|uniref:HesA/MoeB/ThiF family protein n=1 Tax=Roseovarius sp. EL26 TaxID=2126672 RepID=UPI000EA3D9A0|nr:HesA/MoeB/ThiF family protein [Roseovarius sp. EL26]
MNRYDRQEMVIGALGQARLSHAHMLVVGAGGLGCAALPYLVAAGIGHITLLDPDRVEESNLHRQTLYRMEDVGALKAHAARQQLQALNPAVQITDIVSRLTPANAGTLVAQADLVIDAADSFAVSYILSDHCLQLSKPLISASVLGQTGYVGGYCGKVPSLRAVFSDLPESAANCSTAGVLGPVVGVIGTLQAQMAVSTLSDPDRPALGTMITMDLQKFTTGGFSFATASEPDTLFPFVSDNQLTATDQVIELRSKQEAPKAIHKNSNRLEFKSLTTHDFAPNRRIVLGCKTGLRAWRAATTLQKAGYSNIALMAEVAM